MNVQSQWIELFEKIKTVIKAEWYNLMEQNFYKCIEKILKRCKLVILAKKSFI